MKLTTKKPTHPSFTQVHGGRVLKTTIELVVSTDGQTDEHRGPKKMIATRVGDLAVEVVDTITAVVLGHYFLSGPAMGLIRYGVTWPEHWIDAKAVRVDIDPMGPKVADKIERMMMSPGNDGGHIGWFTSCMVELAHRFDLAYFGNLHVPLFETIAPCATSIQKTYSLNDAARTKICHVMGQVHCPPAKAEHRIQGQQPVAYVHCFPPSEGQHPPIQQASFGHELLEHADLVECDFWTLDNPPQPAPPAPISEDMLS